MCRCRRYIRFMRRVASTGQEESAPISRKYADILTPLLGCDRSLLPMFARQGCDRWRVAAWDRENGGLRQAPRRCSHLPAVAKLQRARDKLVGLLIRGTDEHAAYLGRSSQQQERR